MTQFIERLPENMDWNTVITQELQQAGIPSVLMKDIPWMCARGYYDRSRIVGAFKKPMTLRFNTEDTHIVFERRSGSYSVYDSNIPVEVAIEIARSEHGPEIRPGNTPDEDHVVYIQENTEVFDFKTRKNVYTRGQVSEFHNLYCSPDKNTYIVDDNIEKYFNYIHYYKIHSVEGLKYFAEILRKYKLVEDM